MSQVFMFKHNVDTARKYAHTLSLSDNIAIVNIFFRFPFSEQIYANV